MSRLFQVLIMASCAFLSPTDSATQQALIADENILSRVVVGKSDLFVGGRFKIEKKHYFNQHSKVCTNSRHSVQAKMFFDFRFMSTRIFAASGHVRRTASIAILLFASCWFCVGFVWLIRAARRKCSPHAVRFATQDPHGRHQSDWRMARFWSR